MYWTKRQWWLDFSLCGSRPTDWCVLCCVVSIEEVGLLSLSEFGKFVELIDPKTKIVAATSRARWTLNLSQAWHFALVGENVPWRDCNRADKTDVSMSLEWGWSWSAWGRMVRRSQIIMLWYSLQHKSNGCHKKSITRIHLPTIILSCHPHHL